MTICSLPLPPALLAETLRQLEGRVGRRHLHLGAAAATVHAMAELAFARALAAISHQRATRPPA